MSFYDELGPATAREREFLLAAPTINAALTGDITLPLYRAFLTEAWHHVRHTVPLLMAAGSRLPERLRWLQGELLNYIAEERGHDEWILADIAAAGGNAAAVATSTPLPATDAFVAYIYDTIERRNPVGLFGMVYVLEGTSVALAIQAADRIQATLGLPDAAFTYLRSHGLLDQEHVGHLQKILGRLTDTGDQAAITQCARVAFWLYGMMFRSLEASTPASAVPPLRRSA